MELAFALFADAAQVTSDGKITILGGGFDSIRATRFPALHPAMSLVVRLNLTLAECERTHSLRIELVGPLGQVVFPPAITQFTPTRPPAGREDDANFTVVANMPNLLFEMPGTYRLHLTVDGERTWTYRLHLEQVRAEPVSGAANNRQ